MNWLGAGVLIVLVIIASDASPLFIFSPDVGLHAAPMLQGKQGEPTHGTVLQDSVVSSALGGQRRPFLVYLPPSYQTPVGRTRRYPTLYLLHGSTRLRARLDNRRESCRVGGYADCHGQDTRTDYDLSRWKWANRANK